MVTVVGVNVQTETLLKAYLARLYYLRGAFRKVAPLSFTFEVKRNDRRFRLMVGSSQGAAGESDVNFRVLW